MIYTVKAIAVMIEVGTKLWINAAQVNAVYPCYNLAGDATVCIDVGAQTRHSNWPLEQVLEAIRKVSR